MSDDPKNYQLDAEVTGIIWAALFESGNTELARVLSDTMIAQGCQELKGTTDFSLILMFWKTIWRITIYCILFLPQRS